MLRSSPFIKISVYKKFYILGYVDVLNNQISEKVIPVVFDGQVLFSMITDDSCHESKCDNNLCTT